LRFFQASLSFVLLAAVWSAPPPRPQATSYPLRFDDQLSSASIKASSVPSSARTTDPIVWENFFSPADVTWTLLRGRLGHRNGDLIVKGEGSTPVIVAPKEPAIEWGLFEAVEIRMSASAGSEVKIRIGDFDAKQKLGPPGQYRVYRFDVNINAAKGTRPLAIMPTDDLNGLVAIHSIRLVPRIASFPQPFGRQNLGKRDEYRNVIYVHSPSSMSFGVTVPKNGRLHFAVGVTAKDSPVGFHVAVEGSANELYGKTLSDPDIWEDADVDLSAYSGRNIKLLFRTQAAHEGAVGLWANALLISGAATRPNVLIYTIDTLRADHASVYGYSRETTPFLRKLGASGVVFNDCQAQATWTKASVASLLTSLYSYTHGLINDYDTIPKGAATLAEQLRAAGYVTASIVANPYVGRTTGLDRGFDYMLEYPTVLRQRTEVADRGTDSSALNKVVFPWLEHHRNEPFFLYAHATDPHAPYRPPPGFEEKFANPAETPAFDRDYAKLRDERQYGGGTVVSRAGAAKAGLDPEQFIRRAVDRYDGEILHNDRSFELLVNRLKELGALDNTLIIVVSDHGEEFWDHGWTAHGHSVYQELTHCTFLMWNPRLLPTARHISTPVQLVDVMPTVLDLLGLKIPGVVQGQSVAPLARGQAFQRRGLVVSSRFAHPGARQTGFVPENRTGSFALIDAKWKLIYRDNAKEAGIPSVELYDRTADLGEHRNVAQQHPRDVERLMAELSKWIEAQKRIRTVLGRGANSTLDQQTLDQLRSLGYLGGSSQ
jgi:choline-sulfatase